MTIGAAVAAPAVRIQDSVIKTIATLLDTAADDAVTAYLSTSIPLTAAILGPHARGHGHAHAHGHAHPQGHGHEHGHHELAMFDPLPNDPLTKDPLTTDVVKLVSTHIRWGGGALDRGVVGAPPSQVLADMGA